MREILFRGKSKDNGEWVFGNFSKYPDSPDVEISKVERPVGTYKVIPETVGQYTGLTDKNGKKIFEGDVVKITIGDLRKIGTVKYSERAGSVGIIEPDKNWNFSFMQQPLVKQYDIIVLGSIFDDPELLIGAYNA